MNKGRKNIVYIGSDSYYKESLKICNVNNKNMKFVKLDSLEKIDRKQGFLLLLTMDDLYDYFSDVVDTFEPNVYEIDRHVRKIFKNFSYVIIISIEEFDYGHIPFSNIYVEFANKYFDTNKGISILIDELDEKYNNKKELKLSRIKEENIEKLRKYIKNKEFFTTKEIMNNFGVNEKWIQRYMKDMNSIYNNIGYNKKKRVWYTVKNNYKI